MTDQKTISATGREEIPARKKNISPAHSAEERRYIIREYKKHFSSKDNEDSEAWVRLIRESRTYYEDGENCYSV
ncbi:MAG: hypothetical protein ABFS45_08065 [Pseudomonadota bacterium]